MIASYHVHTIFTVSHVLFQCAAGIHNWECNSCLTWSDHLFFLNLILSVQAMLFLSFSDDRAEEFRTQFHEAANQYSANNISFLIGDVTASQGAFQVIFCLLFSITIFISTLLCPNISYKNNVQELKMPAVWPFLNAQCSSILGLKRVKCPSFSY